ncbi:uncharacterized protein [Hyperolius riggenbachi]|uniref:uncharacterized protein n=1 Tax=Hyperolius riggenbachi TaxID=752182 RepID=UPI0035A350B1
MLLPFLSSRFDHLLTILRPHLLKKDTRMRKAITPEEQLMITLRFLVTGQSYGSLHLTFRVGKSTISAIVNRTSRAIWCSLVAKYMPVPDSRKWAEIADLYWNRCNFPNCLGAIDGKHVRLQKPARSGSLYFNYKKYFSLVLLAVADADYNFIYVDVGSYGGSSDSGIFQRSRLHRLLNDDKLDIPGDKPWPGTTSPSYPYVFVGDEAFALSQHVMRPFGQRGLRREKRVFNYRLTRARRMVEYVWNHVEQVEDVPHATTAEPYQRYSCREGGMHPPQLCSAGRRIQHYAPRPGLFAQNPTVCNKG